MAMPPPSTVREFMSNPDNNPFGTDNATKWNGYAQYSREYRVDASPLGNQDVLVKAAAQFQNHPSIGALAMIVMHGGKAVLKFVFGLHQYLPPPAESNAALAGRYFGYLGDVAGGDAPLVEITAGYFAPIPTVINVYRLAENHRLLLADPQLNFHPSIADDAAQIDTIRARKTVFVPFDLVPLLMGDLEPRAAFLIAYDWIHANGNVDHVAPLLNLLRAGCTLSGTATVPTVIVGQAGDPFTPSAVLMRTMRTEVLESMLPGLATTPAADAGDSSTVIALHDVVVRLSEATIARDQADDARRADKEKPKPITDLYPADDGLVTLLRMCRVATAELLPPIYQALANTTKKLGAVSVLQSKVNALAAKQNPTVIAPLIQQATANCFKTLCFHGNDAYDLSSGMLPASIVPSKVYSSLGTQLIKEVEAINANVSMWNAAGSTVTTDDLKLIHKVKHFVPTKFEEALLQIQGFLMLLGVAMGETHPLYLGAFLAYDRIVEDRMDFERMITAEHGTVRGPSMLVYFFQFYIRYWFERQYNSVAAIPVPQLLEKVEQCLMEQKITDFLPPITHHSFLLNLGKAPSTPIDSGGGGGTRSNRVPEPKRTSTRVLNAEPDQRYDPSTVFGRKVATMSIATERKRLDGLTPAVPMPVRPSGGERCIAWHAKGACFEACSRAADHKPLADAEKEEVYKYVCKLCQL